MSVESTDPHTARFDIDVRLTFNIQDALHAVTIMLAFVSTEHLRWALHAGIQQTRVALHH